MWQEFKAFLVKQNALALAIAVVIGAALDTVVKSIVADIIMPVVGMAAPGGTWQQWTLGPFGIGRLLAALLNFVIVGFVAWRISKMFIRPAATAAPAQATRDCPHCFMGIDARAARCPHCTSQLAGAA